MTSDKSSIIQRLKHSIAHAVIPFGLPSPYGTVYGWNIQEMRHFQEEETFEFFKKHLTKNDIVADIGANIGLFTLFFSNYAQQVYSFEPSPAAYKRLTRAVQNRKNVKAYNAGIFSREDTLKLYAARKGDPMGSMMYERGSSYDEVPVYPLKKIDAKFTWAKIDVEGAEIEVLKGMDHRIPAVLEVANGILETYGGGVKKFFTEIEELGYNIYFIVDKGETVPYKNGDISPLQNNIYIEPRTN